MTDLYEKLRSSGLLLPPNDESGGHLPPVRRGPVLPVIRLNIRELKMYGVMERERGERERERERGRERERRGEREKGRE